MLALQICEVICHYHCYAIIILCLLIKRFFAAGNLLILARLLCSTNQRDELPWRLKDSRYSEIQGINGVIWLDLKWQRDPSSFQIQCTSSVDFVGWMLEIAIPLAGHSYHRSHCFHCKDFISHHSGHKFGFISKHVETALGLKAIESAQWWFVTTHPFPYCGKDSWLCKLDGHSNCLHMGSIYFWRWTFS